MEDFFNSKLTPAHLLIEILRTQAFVKGLAKQLLDTSQYSQLITNHNNMLLKCMMQFVENNHQSFENPDALIRDLLSQMTE